MAAFPKLNSDDGLKKLDEHLLTRYYITSHKASKDDITVYAALSKPPPSQYVNASRWYNHIETLLSISGISSEGSGVAIDGLASITEEDGRVVVFDDDQDVDLIMEEAEEEKRAASLKASTEKKESWESAVIIIIPKDAETDMKKLEKDLRSIQMEEGLFWGASKRVPIGYGHELLRIVATVPEDEEFDTLGNLVDTHICKLGNFSIHTAGLYESLLLIKPNDDEADMKKLEEAVRSIQARGLFWGASRLVPVGCGIKLLGIECTAVGCLMRPGRIVLFDDIVKEEIMGHRYVQSCQTLGLNRICNGITSEEESDSKDDANAALFGEERTVSLKESGKSGLMIVNLSLLNPNIKKSEESVRSIQKGVVWEESKIINAGYGFKFLRMIFTIVDDLVCLKTLNQNFGGRVIPLNRISGKSGLLLVALSPSYPDIKKLDESLRSIQREGLVWENSKTVNAGYGINYLGITFTIVGDQASLNTAIQKFDGGVIPLTRNM